MARSHTPDEYDPDTGMTFGELETFEADMTEVAFRQAIGEMKRTFGIGYTEEVFDEEMARVD